MKKVMFVLMALMLAITAFSAFAECDDCCDGGPCYGDDLDSQTLDVIDCVVEINDEVVKHDVSVLPTFDRGEDLEVEVKFVSQQNAEDVSVTVMLLGYHRQHKYQGDLVEMSSTFDVEANRSYKRTLTIKLPDDFEYDTGDELKLRVLIADKYSSTFIREYNFDVEPQRDNVVIQDIILDPADRVEAGRGMFASVRVRNMGTKDEESVKVEVSMPGLGIKASEYIDELEEDEATTSEDLFLRIPSCTEPGTYVVRATVDYADGDEEVSEDTTIVVGEDPSCDVVKPSGDDKTVVTVPGRQDVVKGTTGSVYPVILQNNGATDRSYELSVSGLDAWATYRFDPGAFVVIKSGETKTIYMYVTPNEDAQPGEKVFMVSVETSGDSKQIALTANVVESEEGSELALGDLRKALEIGVVVLIVLLIILGLIVGFNKLKGSEDPEDVSGQTYY